MLDKHTIIKLIQQSMSEIKNYGVKRIGLFGSFIRASQSGRSDVDVLVEFFPGKKNFDNYMDLKFFLEKLLRRKVDLVVKEAVKSRIKKHILKEVLYA